MVCNLFSYLFVFSFLMVCNLLCLSIFLPLGLLLFLPDSNWQSGTADFVIYLGDVITANNIPIANASLYWDQALSPTRARGIPWASVFGNHDDAPFEWPMEWFSVPGIPPLHCPATNSSYSGELKVQRYRILCLWRLVFTRMKDLFCICFIWLSILFQDYCSIFLKMVASLG